MPKASLLFFIIFSFINAVELKIYPSRDLNISDSEADILIMTTYKNRGIKPTKEAAKKKIYENRVLADAYLKKYNIPTSLLINKKLEIEEALAKEYIKRFQKNVTIKNNVLKSYYVVHKKEFHRPQTIVYYPIEFDSFDRALQFYFQAKKNINIAKEYTKQHEIKKYKVPKERIFLPIRKMFDNVKTSSILPPIYLGDSYVVFYVSHVLPGKELTFDEAKDKIRKILLRKSFNQTRNELLEELSR